jgi:CDP-paratose 2-epimerase
MTAFPYQTVLVTGGAGFVGSNLALWFKSRYPGTHVVAADNLKRRGSETNIPRLQTAGIEFLHADIRNPEDLAFANRKIDLLLECSAEPSVLAGYGEAPSYLINTNLLGTINCLELARKHSADFVFLSTSRVYPVKSLNEARTSEDETRFVLSDDQTIAGLSARGVAENFPLEGARSLYGTTKLASELVIQEYGEMYGLRYLINRCGVLTGPWQMGKPDQGVFALWMAMHYFKKELKYIGWGGTGKQVRDLLHVDDLADLLDIQLGAFDKLNGGVFNVGGGTNCSLSLLETTLLCREITGNNIPVNPVVDNRPADLKVYITDNSRVQQATGWTPKRDARQTMQDIYSWLKNHESQVKYIWGI